MSWRATSPWPELPLDAWRGTRDTLHLCSQVVGKTLLARAPARNHWWHATLRLSARGLATPLMLDGDRSFDGEIDLQRHEVALRTSDGRSAAVPLRARPVREFYEEYVAALASLGLEVPLWATPCELPHPLPLDRDDVHREYDPAWARRFWEVLRRCDAALQQLAVSYVGKQSPVHFFWGSFDLAATRFSGRRAPARPGADPVTREAYSHECISFGFWPGGTLPSGAEVGEAMLYAYAAPEPEGFRDAAVRPSDAHYDAALGEFVLPYEAVRAERDPAALIGAFCESVYEAGATLGGWDRAALEREPPGPPLRPDAGEGLGAPGP